MPWPSKLSVADRPGHAEAARPLAVAVACSGLGHINRGIESWAQDLARGLSRTGIAVTLFGSASPPGSDVVPLPCWRRTGGVAILLARLMRHLSGWRYGFGSAYEVEQTSFALFLWWRIRRHFDILHVQDPTIAKWLDAVHRLGLSRPRVIVANGTGEQPGTLARLSHVQYLTPSAASAAPPGQRVHVAPNMVDVATFRPGDRVAARAALGLPPDAFIVLSCAAIRRFHKRIDVVLEAFTLFAQRHPEAPAFLVLAGGREADTDELVALGQRLLGGRARFLVGFPRAKMPELYRAADLFVLGSLFETFGIVLIEAMASGLPVVCHDTADFRYVVGPGGLCCDIAAKEGLAQAIANLLDPVKRQTLAAAARAHVEANFSEGAVVPIISAIYREVVADGGRNADG